MKWRVKINSQIAGSHVVLSHERLLCVDDLVNAEIGMEVGLNGIKNHGRAISTAAAG